MDDTDAEFRSRVEQIRQLGGDSWLRILDEIQGEEEMVQVLRQKVFKRYFLSETVPRESNAELVFF